MALTSHNGILCNTVLDLRRPFIFPSNPTSSSFPMSRKTPIRFTVSAASKKFSSRTGRFDSKNRRSSTATTKEKVDEDEVVVEAEQKWTAEVKDSGAASASASAAAVDDDGFVMPELPGQKPDFWEGPQWDLLGFFVQYMWAFGIVFALIACGIAVATYNEGATDFKETPVYRESIQSRDLLEEPEASNSDVFESNPTEEAPSLE